MNDLKQTIDECVTLAKEATDESIDKSEKWLDSTKKEAIKVANKCSWYIRHNPWKSISFSLLAGLLVTQLFRLRKPR